MRRWTKTVDLTCCGLNNRESMCWRQPIRGIYLLFPWLRVRAGYSCPARKFFGSTSIVWRSTLRAMTTAADRRRIPGPASSYAALPLSAYTSDAPLAPSAKRTRPALEARKLCTSFRVTSSNTWNSHTDRSDDNCSRICIHRDILSINTSRSLYPRTSSPSLDFSIYSHRATQYHLLTALVQWHTPSSKSTRPSNPTRTIPRPALRKINKTHVTRPFISQIRNRCQHQCPRIYRNMEFTGYCHQCCFCRHSRSKN